MSSPLSSPQARWYVAWSAVVLLLVALPILVFATRGTSSTADPLAPPSTSPPSPSAAASEPPSASPTAHPAKSGAPALSAVPLCSNVWQPGRTLPADYAGCQRSGAVHKPQHDRCLVTYQARWWARPGQSVHESKGSTAQDKAYAAALADC